METSGKTRSGRKRARTQPSRSVARQKEGAEHARIQAQVAGIPILAPDFVFRVNRRQRAKQREAKEASKEAVTEAPVLHAKNFSNLPISVRTQDGLAAASFTELTPVQQRAIPQALAGRDVLVAAPTGSGKTLAFIVPLLECLWRCKWSTLDKLGAIVLAPTRELALQIFQVLRVVAKRHMISAGLVIGGKDFGGESTRVANMNVLVATPGRLLHHMDHIADLDCNNLQMLVLDEADRILDLGFQKTLDAILQNLPKDRQTLLFSATQTKSVKALARLSLKSPQYVSVMSRHSPPEIAEAEEEEEGDAHVDENDNRTSAEITDSEAVDTELSAGVDSVKIVGTPTGLSQSYAVVKSHEKLSVLWSFIKSHLKSKMIIFFATGKQVRFTFEAFCKLRPGISLLHIHGNMKQLRRTDMYDAFSKTANAVLFATDVASRGLDFPNVDWVIQVDCPEDVSTYVHRVGRTARFKSNGRSMLFLCEGEEEHFIEQVLRRRITLNKAKINPKRIATITPRLSALVATKQELKTLAQRAFLFYLKSIHQQSDKEVFDTADHDIALLAKSFGLAVTPVVKFKGGTENSENAVAKNDRKTVFGYRPRTVQKTVDRHQQGPHNAGDAGEEQSPRDKRTADEDDILKVRRVIPTADEDEVLLSPTEAPKRQRKRMKLDLVNKMPSVSRIVFDEDGVGRRASELALGGESDTSLPAADQGSGHADISEYASAVAQRLQATAEADKRHDRERVRAKHVKRREKLRDLNKMLKPNADMQKQQLAGDAHVEGASSDIDSSVDNCSLGSAPSEDESADENAVSGTVDGTAVKSQEELALQILAARR